MIRAGSVPARLAVYDALLAAAFGLAVRLAVALWAWDRFPPVDDGSFYHVVASRIAQGQGYTWLWPDGVVTYAAHYPVGYPGLLGAAYAIFGAAPAVGMFLNAAIGAASVFFAQRLASRAASRFGALAAALLVALHPGLLFYTPALMTEGVVAELLVVVAWLAVRAGEAERSIVWTCAVGLACGGLTLMRPEFLLLAPVFGFVARGGRTPRMRESARHIGLVSLLAVAVCLPWTARNCARMDRCVFVSANAGWNLLIGSAASANGAWLPMERVGVPPECRNVFGEAEKDRCFGHAAVARIQSQPLAFLALVPKKLSATFDFSGAAGHYLHASNASAFGEGAKLRLDIVETIWERLVLIAAILQAVRAAPRRPSSWVLGAVSMLFALVRAAWVAHLGFVLLTALGGSALARQPVRLFAAAVVGVTALAHAVFFGGGRYGLVCAALLCVAAVGERSTVRTGARALPVPPEPEFS